MTEQNSYPSKYSNGKNVSAAQFITEIICENKAIKEKRDLHYKFWTNKEWAQFYRNQIASAHKLLKTYSPSAIIKALKHTKARNIYSLRAPHLIPIIEQEQAILNQQKPENKNYDETRQVKNVKFRQNINHKPNIISKLRELDNGT
jgi:hypothetical protein